MSTESRSCRLFTRKPTAAFADGETFRARPPFISCRFFLGAARETSLGRTTPIDFCNSNDERARPEPLILYWERTAILSPFVATFSAMNTPKREPWRRVLRRASPERPVSIRPATGLARLRGFVGADTESERPREVAWFLWGRETQRRLLRGRGPFRGQVGLHGLAMSNVRNPFLSDPRALLVISASVTPFSLS